MAIDFNTAPYYDDFDKSKNFYRILFKPGRAVQARELTQLQSILQNQIESFGSHIFKDGSLVYGGKTFVGTGLFLKLSSSSASLDTFSQSIIEGATSGATAKVILVSQATSTQPDIFYITNVFGNFQNGETISIQGTTTTAVLNSNAATFSGPVSFFSIEEGIFFVRGHFVYCDPQTIVVSPTLEPIPSARIGLEVVESVITSEDDPSLLDPAVGTNNYFAPGADRYSIELILSSIEYDPNVENSDTSSIDNFIDICNIRFGEIIRLVTDSDYNKLEDALAKRTFEESGDYTVKPFIGTIKPHLYGNTTQFSFELTPGKAYVKGYAFESIAATSLSIDKARDYERIDNFPISADYGRYIFIKDLRGFVDPTSSQIFTLHSNTVANVTLTNANTFSNTTIGTARARYIENTGTSSGYKLYLYDINLNSTQAFSNVRSFISANTLATPVTIATAANISFYPAEIIYGEDDSTLFKIPQTNIKTLLPSGASDGSFTSFKLFESVAFTQGTGADTGNSIATISVSGSEAFIGSGYLSDDAINARFFAVVTGSSGTPTVGNVINLVGAGGSVEITGGGTTAILKTNGTTSFTGNILALHTTTQAISKTKTKTLSNVLITAGSNVYDISLGISDVIYVDSIRDAQGNTFTGSYILDNGQRDDYYDHARVRLKSGANAPNLNVIFNPNLTISFAYFSHSGSGFFSVDSYTNSGVAYEYIPTYTTSRGVKYNLSDVIDFRPVRQPNSNVISATKLVQPGSQFITDYHYYVGRIDKVVVTKDKSFEVIRGKPSLAPEAPKDSPDAMTIYTVDIPPYTKNLKEIRLGFVDNRRYTMRDIGKIDRRLTRLEYYTALSFLEKIAADEKIPSSVPGIDRFKNGILVDPFVGHGIGDVTNTDHSCSIDSESRLLRPLFTSDAKQFYINEAQSFNYIKTGDLITPLYTEVPYISQLKASRTTYLVPYEVFSWAGEMVLDPATDVWHDTYTNPSVVVNLNGENDAFTQITLENNGLNPWGTKWNSWQSIFRGITDVAVDTAVSSTTDTRLNVDSAGNLTARSTTRSDTTTTTDISTSESFSRTGLAFSSAQKTITTNLGSRLIDSSLIPFIRSRPIKFYAKNLKPNTDLFAIFDNVDVTKYCAPAVEMRLSSNITGTLAVTSVSSGVSSGTVVLQKNDRLYFIPNVSNPLFQAGNSVTITFSNGSTVNRTILTITVPNRLRTNDYGDVAGIFVIPNNNELKFNIGERPFKLADSLNKAFVTTAAQTTYLAHGISTTSQSTTLATRMNLVSVDPLQDIVTENQGITRRTTNNSVTTVGEASTVALPPTHQITQNINNITQNITNIVNNSTTNINFGVAVDITNYGTQDISCGQIIESAGLNGIRSFNINLGSGSLGQANVVCTPGITPVRFKLTYRGNEIDSGFIVSSQYPIGVDPNGYRFILERLGFNNAVSNTSPTVTLNVHKLTVDEEFALLEITAPIPGDAWNITIQCPTIANPVPGSTQVVLTKSASGNQNPNFIADNDWYWTWRDQNNNVPTFSAALKLGYQFTILNQSNDPNFARTWDGIVRINSITLDSANVIESRSGPTTTYTLQTSGTSFDVFDGSLYTNWRDTRGRDVNRGIAGVADDAESWTNTLGTLPAVLNPGESRTFTVVIDHPRDSVVNGPLNVLMDVTNITGTQPATYSPNRMQVSTTVQQTRRIIDPIAQTFFIDSEQNPNGVFLTSVDLWFASKSPSVPVTIEVRPVVNGFPSSFEIVPFGTVTVDAENIVVSSTPNIFQLSESTRFTFRSPVYCTPGQYSIVIKGNATDFRIYTAVLGEFEIGSDNARITQQPYIGSMFKSQNASTWTPEQLEDVTFRINVASFDTNAQASVQLKTLTSPYDIDYDVFYAFGETLSFTNTKTNFYYKSQVKSTDALETTFTPYQLGKNIPMNARRVVRAGNDNSLQLSLDLSTDNEDVAPVIDLNRLNSVLVKNIINNDATGEDQYGGGNASSRYITRKVTLAEGFESTDLKVYVNGYCPSQSSFKVYCKVNAPGTTQFDSQNKYQELTLTSETGNKREGFAEFIFETTNNSILPDGAKFNTFVIKIVMLSPDPVFVPILKDLRVLALDEY